MDGITIDGTDNLLEAFARLDSRQMKTTHRKTLNSVITKLQTEARKNIRGVTGRYNTRTKTSKGTPRGPLIQGITKRVWKSVEGATVTILGDYRLKWFESGTTDRTTKGKFKSRYKKPKVTGKMSASHFFKRAIESKQGSVQQEINDTLAKEIKRQFEK